MIKGFMRLKQVPAGALVRFDWGAYAIVSEYHPSDANHADMFTSGSGEYLHCTGDEWVAVMDMENIEAQLSFDEFEYPKDTPRKPEKLPYGNALVAEDEHHHIPGLKSQTLCGQEITARVRGLTTCDCPLCIDTAHQMGGE